MQHFLASVVKRFKIEISRNIRGFLFSFSYAESGSGYKEEKMPDKLWHFGVSLGMMFRHLLNLIRQPECLLCLFVFPPTISENSLGSGNSEMIPPGQSQAELAVKDHPTLLLCLASGFHLQIQVGFGGDPHSLEAHEGEDFGFL